MSKNKYFSSVSSFIVIFCTDKLLEGGCEEKSLSAGPGTRKHGNRDYG